MQLIIDLHCSKRISGFDLAPPATATAMMPGATVTAAAGATGTHSFYLGHILVEVVCNCRKR